MLGPAEPGGIRGHSPPKFLKTQKQNQNLFHKSKYVSSITACPLIDLQTFRRLFMPFKAILFSQDECELGYLLGHISVIEILTLFPQGNCPFYHLVSISSDKARGTGLRLKRFSECSAFKTNCKRWQFGYDNFDS